MKTRLLRLAAPAAFALLAALASGCSKTYVTIDLGDGSSPGQNGGNSNASLIRFHASVESRAIPSKSISPLAKNVQAKLLVFEAAATSLSRSPIAVGFYESVTPGTLSGIDGYNMYLPNGTYNFYAVSDNLPSAPVTFTAGTSAPLTNGIDYLWWGGTDHDVSVGQTSIPIVFTHSATQVSFEVTAGEGITLNQLVAATITPTEPGARMDLSTGLIPSSTGYDKTTPDAAMGINGTLAQYIMLPLKTSDPMKATFTVLVNGEATSRTYTVDVPVPGDVLVAGDSYRFKAVINGDAITLPSVGVADWVDVDETGKPLYPQQ